jgi:predicted nucleic acid-binding protein
MNNHNTDQIIDNWIATALRNVQSEEAIDEITDYIIVMYEKQMRIKELNGIIQMHSSEINLHQTHQAIMFTRIKEILSQKEGTHGEDDRNTTND